MDIRRRQGAYLFDRTEAHTFVEAVPHMAFSLPGFRTLIILYDSTYISKRWVRNERFNQSVCKYRGVFRKSSKWK